MILEELKLRNFCLFRGEQSFNLAPKSRNGKHLPITLFGGINGGGKTTLLDAIQLALYGGRARCSKRSTLAYEEFLRASIHHGVNGGEHAGVTLSFRYAADGQEHLYDVARRWKVSDGRVREELRVFRDGAPEQWLSENWAQLVEELFPLDISQLFFFDAEKIRTLAEDESSSKALGAAIKSLLGLDIVERLITDSSVLQGRLAKRVGTPEQLSEIESLEALIRQHEERVTLLVTDRATLENERLRAETMSKQAEAAFAASGGKHWESREERSRRLGELESLDGTLKTQLVGLASGDLPLVLARDLLVGLEEQDKREQVGADAELIRELLEDRDAGLVKLLRRAKASTSVVQRVQKYLADDRKQRQPSRPISRRLSLSEAGRSLLQQLLGNRLASHREEAGQLIDQLAQVNREQEDLERAKAAAPEDADIATLVEEFKKATGAFAAIEQQARRLDATIEEERDKVKEFGGKLKKLWDGRMDREFAGEDVARMIELAGKTRETMQAFLQRVTRSKIDRLSALITESFRFLLRKRSLIERIIIDPETFAITLYDEAGLAIAKERLSEGEKQIFAVSVLWGLARASARPLPAAIDTPMARLDSAHRQHLVSRYFPNASHQVIIFSTDTEVDRKYYEDLQPHIARAYHLNYDERGRYTIGEEGYFWKVPEGAELA